MRGHRSQGPFAWTASLQHGMSRGDRSLEEFTRWDLFHSKIAVFMTFSIYKIRLSPCGDGKLLLLLFLLLFISDRAYWTVFKYCLKSMEC